jgi:hypothetical protein
MYIYVCIYIYIYLCLYIYIYIYICICLYVYIKYFLQMFLYLYTYIKVSNFLNIGGYTWEELKRLNLEQKNLADSHEDFATMRTKERKGHIHKSAKVSE